MGNIDHLLQRIHVSLSNFSIELCFSSPLNLSNTHDINSHTLWEKVHSALKIKPYNTYDLYVSDNNARISSEYILLKHTIDPKENRAHIVWQSQVIFIL